MPVSLFQLYDWDVESSVYLFIDTLLIDGSIIDWGDPTKYSPKVRTYASALSGDLRPRFSCPSCSQEVFYLYWSLTIFLRSIEKWVHHDRIIVRPRTRCLYNCSCFIPVSPLYAHISVPVSIMFIWWWITIVDWKYFIWESFFCYYFIQPIRNSATYSGIIYPDSGMNDFWVLWQQFSYQVQHPASSNHCIFLEMIILPTDTGTIPAVLDVSLLPN